MNSTYWGGWLHQIMPRMRPAEVAEHPAGMSEGLFYALGSVALVLMAGLMSGLTLGLMSLGSVDMELLKRTGTPVEKQQATRIGRVIRNPHFLLVTLLMCNAVAMEGLPLLLDQLVDPVTAVVLSVSVVLLVGEIIPQAVCAKYGVAIGSFFAPFVTALMWLCSPLAWPISKLLDSLVGHRESAVYRRPQLKALVSLHSLDAGWGGHLTEDEINIISGALDLTTKTASVSMTPLDKVFMLSSDAVLDEATMKSIIAAGHSRVPVHLPGDRHSIVGLVLVKELVKYHAADRVPLSEVRLRSLPRLPADIPMFDLLDLFQIGRSHMAVITEVVVPYSPGDINADTSDSPHGDSSPLLKQGSSPPLKQCSSPLHRQGSSKLWAEVTSSGKPLGIITLEDVIEELMQVEIVDETDHFVDNLQTVEVDVSSLVKALPPRLRRALSFRSVVNVVRAALPPGATHQSSWGSDGTAKQDGGVAGVVDQLAHGKDASTPDPNRAAQQQEQQQQPGSALSTPKRLAEKRQQQQQQSGAARQLFMPAPPQQQHGSAPSTPQKQEPPEQR